MSNLGRIYAVTGQCRGAGPAIGITEPRMLIAVGSGFLLPDLHSTSRHFRRELSLPWLGAFQGSHNKLNRSVIFRSKPFAALRQGAYLLLGQDFKQLWTYRHVAKWYGGRIKAFLSKTHQGFKLSGIAVLERSAQSLAKRQGLHICAEDVLVYFGTIQYLASIICCVLVTRHAPVGIISHIARNPAALSLRSPARVKFHGTLSVMTSPVGTEDEQIFERSIRRRRTWLPGSGTPHPPGRLRVRTAWLGVGSPGVIHAPLCSPRASRQCRAPMR
ncbi:hypothetical protein FVE85_6141 [Porphyridium purpureum]|uniref:Uncharacterized protein n=1 Tax=Porphyridium purpureum TaxID=35688 RepID=A0A5J4Z4I0_PORPP|nr:hypothetical protein FVE85_6141 [Porphyridium purpureum]|eukprot:POR7281..scf295_1